MSCARGGSGDDEDRRRPGERVETPVWVLITQRSQVQILPPLQSKTAGQRPLLSQKGPLALPTRDQIRDRNRLEWALRRWDGAGD